MLKPGFKCGMKTECALIQRTALHANELVITHPTSKEILHLKAPYSKDFNAALRMLHRYPPD
jgi:23S rRNA-/tRNA-specific pseudouridylate synthase